MRKRTETILALDPGLRDLGYAVLRGARLLDYGVRPLRVYPPDQRIAAGKAAVRAWIRGYAPSSLVWEAAPNHSVVGHARIHRFIRSAARMAEEAGIETASYPAKTVRQNVVGDGWATKEEVAEAITRQFPQLRVYLGNSRKWKERHWYNMYDALATGLHHQTVRTPPSRGR